MLNCVVRVPLLADEVYLVIIVQPFCAGSIRMVGQWMRWLGYRNVLVIFFL